MMEFTLAIDDGGTSRGVTAGLRVVVLQDIDSVIAVRDSIEDLCEDLCEANVFYEPWFLFPALQHLGAQQQFRFLCVYEAGRRQGLCGFLPLIEGRLHPLLPLKTFDCWAHGQCFRCTPLVRKGFAEAFWQAVLSWLESRPWDRRLLHLQKLPAHGELWRALQVALGERRSLRALSYAFDTAFLRIRHDYEHTLSRAMSNNTRRKREQQRRQLARKGTLAFTDIGSGPALDAVIEAFLQLEAGGWKGRDGTALASTEREAAFFREVIRAAHDRGRLSFLALQLEDRMIAGQCSLLGESGGFLFKIAYDEAFGRYSPGTLLAMEETRRLNDPDDPLRAGLAWVDSCAGPTDGPYYRCWPGRAPVARYRVTTRGTPHALVMAQWPWVRRLLRGGGSRLARLRTSGRRVAGRLP